MKREKRESVLGDIFEIVKTTSQDRSWVKFLKTGYECSASDKLIQDGLVYDPTELIKDKNSWTEYKETYTSNCGHVVKTYLKKGKKVKMFYPDTGYHTEAYIDNVKSGKFRDPFRPTLLGVAYSGLPDKSKPYYKQAKQLWGNMIKRCYDPLYEGGYYGKAFTDDRWLSLENFVNDISKIKNFDQWLKGHNRGLKYNLDKDFLVDGNDTYSRFLCIFLPDSFNKSVTSSNVEKVGARVNNLVLIQ